MRAAALLIIASWVAAGVARAEECIDFKWDVRQERTLFAKAPLERNAGTALKSAPLITPKRLYRLKLHPQAGIQFEVTPARAPGEGTFAGLALLKIPKQGNYRVALDIPAWIDVAANGVLLTGKDYQGQSHCNPPHKIVVFELASAPQLVLQLSSSSSQAVLLTLTPVPDRVQ